jgi:hypothetical protein
MTEERAIWVAAAYLIAKHGGAALSVAERHVVRFAGQSADEQRENWVRIAQATLELLRTPQRGEAMH